MTMTDIEKPSVLLVSSAVREIDPLQWARVTAKFNIIYYDCESVAQFCERLAPGGPYSEIQAIVRTGWLDAEPYSTHKIFQADVLKHYPPSMKIITCSGHGYDDVDVEALTSMGIWYCNSPNTGTEAVSNTALYLILSSFRYFTFAEHCARNEWTQSRSIGARSVDPINQVLGIVGMGSIGLAIAKKAAAALSMKVHYFNRSRNAAAEITIQGGATYHDRLESLLEVADCICLACPLTAETYHILSTEQFNTTKPGGVRVVNVGRGSLIDENALLEAMKVGRVVGVGLDVHENEPGVNPDLIDNYMCTVLPHIGVCSRTSWINYEKSCLDNLEEYFFGGNGKPLTPVNSISTPSGTRL